ncbi:MAG: EamA family transporter, partial [Muribaculaceae bacterium]|nr:EamA family transporter [Muribaculaceae bacterium]
AYFLVQPAIKKIGSELVSLYQYLLPVFATLSAVMMGLDRLKWIQIVAMAVIVGGMILTNRGKRRRVSALAGRQAGSSEG